VPFSRILIISILGFVLFLHEFTAASEIKTEDGCVFSEGAAREKAAVENHLPPKVRFSGEDSPDRPLADRMGALNVPGMSFALIKGGKIQWSEGYGVTLAGEEAAVTCDTLFQAASLSKPVTLIAAMRMQEAGLIDIDADIQSYLQEYELPAGAHSADNPVTFRNLLAHTSGLSAGGFMGYAQDEGFPTDIDVLMGTGGSNSPKVEAPHVPGAELAYSGGGYTVAEVAIQDVTGSSFSAAMNKWILGPAGMKRSDFAQPLPEGKHPQAARGHDSGGKAVAGGWRNHPEQAAAGLWSTANDMATFLIEIYKAYHGDSDILRQETVRGMISDRRDGHVYGFRVDGDGESMSIRHYGGNVGYRSFMTIQLGTGDGAVYLTNSDNGIALGEELLFSLAAVYGWPGYDQIEKTRVQRSAEELKELVGAYEFDGGLRVTIDYRTSENAIGIIFPNGDRYSLTPVSGQSEFIHPDTGVEVSFGTSEATQLLTVYGDTAKKVE
jgi:CubicO group peptidase (beta-lactamase class C family)